MSWRSDLESEITLSAQMARLTVEFVGRALGLDELDAPRLSREEIDLLQFAILETCVKIEKAKDIFYEETKEVPS